MDDKELVEVWNKEFEVWFNLNHGFHGFYLKCDDGKYMHHEVELCWRSWLSSKRSQPSVVLPKIQSCEGIYFVDDDYYHVTEVNSALTAAGIKYTIGGMIMSNNDWYERGEFPPVGSHLEVTFGNKSVWHECVVLPGKKIAIDRYAGWHVMQWQDDFEFRPIKSERENAIDEVSKEIRKFGMTVLSTQIID